MMIANLNTVKIVFAATLRLMAIIYKLIMEVHAKLMMTVCHNIVKTASVMAILNRVKVVPKILTVILTIA
jgi:hypothetical protein